MRTTSLRFTILLLALFLFSAARPAAATTTKISLNPATATATPDQPVTFQVIASQDDGTAKNVTDQATLSGDDPTGRIARATYTPGKVGQWTIQATYQSFTTTAAITVTPGTVKEVVVNPNSDPEQSSLGTITKFTATVYDGSNNTIADQLISWAVIGDIGTIDEHGVFTPKKIGTGKVQATVGTVVGEVTVVTNPALITNTAVNTNTTATKTTNTSKNTNVVTNTPPVDNTNAPTVASTTEESKESCTTLKPWLWVVILVVFFLAVIVLYALVSINAVWPAVTALLVAAVLAYVQRKYGCDGLHWWAWVVTLGTVVITAAALQLRPRLTPSV